MNPRSSVAAVLVLTLILQLPVTARAQEVEAPVEDVPAGAPTVVTYVAPALRPIEARLLLVGARPAASPLRLFAAQPEEIRLSRGAKTALIVTAIVVGSLILVGLVVVGSRPGHI